MIYQIFEKNCGRAEKDSRNKTNSLWEIEPLRGEMKYDLYTVQKLIAPVWSLNYG